VSAVAMRADALLDGLAEAGAVAAIAVRGLQLDSRRVQPGEAFVALRGTQRHGIDFAAQALAAGAALVLAEAPAPQDAPQLPQVIWVR